MAVGAHLQAASLNVLCNFTTSNSGGSSPQAPLVQGTDGNFYGTSSGSASGNQGTVFKITPAGVLTTLVTFGGANGSAPYAGLVQGSDGNFYGTTSAGGSNNQGTVFQMTPTGALTTLISFNGANGANPYAGLVHGMDGNFYGTTVAGGSSNDGTIFKITPAGVLTTLVSFNGAAGAAPYAGLIQGNDGNFYGTTYAGGSSNVGTVFMMTPAGVLNLLVSFSGTNGANPYTGLVQGGDGNFYGTTNRGGLSSDGVAFQLVGPFDYYSGVLPVLASLVDPSGVPGPQGLVQVKVTRASDGTPLANAPITLAVTGASTISATTTPGALTSINVLANSSGIAHAYVTFTTSSSDVLVATAQSGSQTTSLSINIGLPSVGAPVFGPVAGTYTSAQAVTITSATSGAMIRYTTDGITTPTETVGTLYFGPLSLSSTTTLKAIAYKTGFIDSPVTTGLYTINIPPAITSPPQITSFSLLHSFSGGGPYSGLIQGTDGRLYGTTSSGGANGDGTVFAVNPDGAGFTTLYTFTGGSDGGIPQAGLVQGTNGRLYGTTAYSGAYDSGTVFAVNMDGTGFAIIYNFTDGDDGANPYGSLIQGTDGRLYGTANQGGASGDGTVFAISPDGTGFTTLYNFSGGIDGAAPQASLIQGTDGRLYGTTCGGGAYDSGTVFAINSGGTGFTTLYSFTGGTDGGSPTVSLIQGTDDRLYGTTSQGGVPGDGTVFALNPDGTGFATLYSFTGGTDGANPQASLIQGTDGRLYGTAIFGGTNIFGTMFAVNPDGTSFATLYAFTGGTDGGNPQASLIRGTDGRLYGTTIGDGATNSGTLFAISNQTVFAGTNATVTVTVTGTAPLSYQWQFNGVDITGATGTTLTLTNVNASNDGSYSVVVSNAYGSASSTAATLTTVIPPPPAAPMFTPAAGAYTSVQSVAITSAGAGNISIFYTTGSDTPTPSSTLYTGPVSISSTTTLNAIGVNAGGSSPVTSGVYTINIPPPIVLQPQITSFSLLHGFTSSSGNSPYAGLIQGSDNRLYGTTLNGGASNNGTVFAMGQDGANFTLLHSFSGKNDGANPWTSLIQGTDGRLYGTALNGGADGKGTVFTVNPDGTGFMTLYSFPNAADGANPQASLIQGTDGRLYGTANSGGTNGDGTVFAINPDGTGFATLYSFTGATDGANPQAGLIQGTDGRLYGTANSGGTNGDGTVFAVNPDGTGFATLYNFTGATDGANPQASLIQGIDGRLYGTAAFGGANGGGAAFAVNIDGIGFTTLCNFTDGSDGANPQARLIQGTDGRLYGTTSGAGTNGAGTVFAVNPDGTGFTTLYSFTAGNDGAFSQAGLIQGADGRFYGTTPSGGANGGGTAFAISSLAVNAGSTATLTVTATGTAPLSYQWQFNGVNIAGATSATLVLTNVNASNDGNYAVIVSNPGGSVTSAATLTVILPPSPSAPVFSPAAGAYNTVQLVSITSTGATSIYYTTNGDTATTDSTLYTGPISIPATTTLNAIGVNLGGSSPMASGTYTIPLLPTVALTAPVQGGQYGATTAITFSGTAVARTSGASITNVTFFSGTTALGNGTFVSGSDSSYTLVLPANTFLRGSYNISMTATDSNGASASTVPVTIQVTDYYNGNLPTLTPLGESGPQGLVSVLVTDSNGSLQANAPITFAVTTGASQLSAAPGGTGATAILVHTNSDGLAQVYANFISSGSDVLTATAQSGTQTTSISVNINPPPSSYIYTTDFEASEGYAPGSLDQQLGWGVAQGSASISSQDAFSRSQSVALAAATTPAQIIQTFPATSGENIVYVDFFAKPSAETDITKSTIFDVGSARFAFLLNTNTDGFPLGVLEVFNGDGQGGGQWVRPSFPESSPARNLNPIFGFNHQSKYWIRLTARLDFTHKTWDLYQNGLMVAADLNFRDNSSTYLSSFTVTGDGHAATALDALSVGATHPLFADVNNDGIDDTWEQKYNLSLSVDDRYLDPAGNGQTVLQDYINGIDPTDYYSGQLPTLTVLNQGGQINSDGSVSVLVTNGAGTPLANAPVIFSTAQGGSSIALAPGGTTLYPSVTVKTGADGTARVYLPQLQSSSGAPIAINIGATSGANTQQQSLTVSPAPPAPVATVISEVVDQRVNEYGVSEFLDLADPGNPYRPGVYAEASSRYTLEGQQDTEDFSQDIIDPQTGHDTQTMLFGIPFPFGYLGPYTAEAYKENVSAFMVSPVEEKGIAYYYYYGMPAPGYFIDIDIIYSKLYPPDYLLTQMKSRMFNFTNTFVDTAQSALLDYEPPITGPKNPSPPHYELAKMHYKLQVPQAVQQANDGTTLAWFEAFTPSDATTPARYLPMSCALAAGQTETPVYTLDPSDTNHLIPNVPSTDPSQNGTWQVVPANITIQSYLNTGGSTWLGNAQPVCVGEPITLTAQLDWPTSMTNPPTITCQWALPQPQGGKAGAIKGYNGPTASSSPEIDFLQHDSALTAQAITFYMPVVPANNTVSCQIKSINGVSPTTPTTITGTLNVVAPSIKIVATQTQVLVTPGLDGSNLGDGIPIVGDPNAGITFDPGDPSTLNWPQGIDPNKMPTGTTCWTQVLKAYNEVGYDPNGEIVLNSVNQIALDNRFYYPQYAGYNNKVFDSPNTGAIINYPLYKEVDFTFKADMYYMWNPGITNARGVQSIWVPVADVYWEFYGQADYDPLGTYANTFTLDAKSHPISPPNPPPILSTTPMSEPTWNSILKNGSIQ